MIAVDLPDFPRTARRTDWGISSGQHGLEELMCFLQIVVISVRRGIVYRLDRAFEFARATIGAFVRLDPDATVSLVDAVNGADVHAGLVFVADATVRNHVGHGSGLICAVPRKDRHSGIDCRGGVVNGDGGFPEANRHQTYLAGILTDVTDREDAR